MAIRTETLVRRHLERWVYLLGLGGWRITWEVVDGPIDHEEPRARNDYFKRRNGYRVAHIRFDRTQITTPVQAERLVIHELLHLFDHGVGNDAHKLIDNLERPLRRARQRLSRS